MPYRKFRNIYVDTSDYFAIFSKIMPFVRDVSDFYGLPLEKLRYNHYKEFCKENLDYTFGSIKELGHISGLTIIKNNNVRIGITTHSSICKERQYFSTMHEIVHTQVHRDHNAKIQQFASVRNSLNTYFDKRAIIMEVEADICASFLMINDYALMEELKKGKSFTQLREEFSVSNACLVTRLMNFLIYNSNYNYHVAQQTLFNYKNDVYDLMFLFPDRL